MHQSNCQQVGSSSIETDTKKITYITIAQEIKGVLQRIQNNPQDPSNYLLAGELYSCQGNQQDSISICEQGLSTISSSDNLLLQQHLILAKVQLEQRLDFVSHCPNEVIYTIISHLDSADSLQCLDVASHWRRKFLNYNNAWRTFNLDGTRKQRKLTQVLRIVSSGIKTLHIHGGVSKLKFFFGSFKRTSFSNLHSLYISDTDDASSADPDIIISKSLYNALGYVSSTLTEIDVTLTTQPHISISPIRILHICPKLKSLKLDVRLLSRIEGRAAFFKSGLTNLIIVNTSPRTWVLWVVLSELFPYLPYLKYLSLFFDVTQTILPGDLMSVLDRFCPELEEIRTASARKIDKEMLWMDDNHNNNDNGSDNKDNNMNDILFPSTDTVATSIITGETTTTDSIGNKDNNRQQESESGSAASIDTPGKLKVLKLHSVDTVATLRFRLENNCNTLRTFSLILGMNILYYGTLNDWQNLTIFTMPNLSSFRLSNGFPSIYLQLLPEILQRFPSLESLYLTNATIGEVEGLNHQESPTQLVNAIIRRPKLKRLGFHMFNVYFKNEGFFEPLMEYYADISQQQQQETGKEINIIQGLTSLQIIGCRGFTATALQHIARIRSLQRLSFSWADLVYKSDPLLTANDIITFTRQLTLAGDDCSLPILSWLELGNIVLPDQAIYNIIMCKSLKKLVVKQLQELSRTGKELLRHHIENM